jgi:hypothetical protein
VIERIFFANTLAAHQAVRGVFTVSMHSKTQGACDTTLELARR